MKFLSKIFANKESQFQQKAIETLRKAYPGVDFQTGADEHSVLVSKHPVDIRELRERCLLNEIESPSIIQQFFSYPVLLANESQTVSWEEAKTKIKPQLVPASFLQGLSVLRQPFVSGIEIGFVLGPDGPFVRSEALASWNVTQNELIATGLKNLSSEEYEMEVTITEGRDRFIGLENDPFSAVRILLPEIRKTAAEKLGEPYFAGIPNRSFLILWSAQSSQRFQEYAAEKVQNDFSVEPFPLSAQVFEATAASINRSSN